MRRSQLDFEPDRRDGFEQIEWLIKKPLILYRALYRDPTLLGIQDHKFLISAGGPKYALSMFHIGIYSPGKGSLARLRRTSRDGLLGPTRLC